MRARKKAPYPTINTNSYHLHYYHFQPGRTSDKNNSLLSAINLQSALHFSTGSLYLHY